MQKRTQAVIAALALVGINTAHAEEYDNYATGQAGQSEEARFIEQSRNAPPPQREESAAREIQRKTIEKNVKYQKDSAFVPSSAEEQGYFNEDKERIAKFKADEEARNDNARQRGEKERVIVNKGIGVKAKAVKKWMPALVSKGVAKEKVLFEAKRLNEKDFVEWATRLYYTL